MSTPQSPVSGQRYDNLDFSGEDFSGCELADCVFTQCRFAGTSFRAADLSRSEFERCQFNDEESELPADFSQAQLREVLFSRCNLTVVDFIRANAYELNFDQCQLQGADLSKADFRMPFGNISGLNAFTMRGCNFSYGNLANTYLAGCTLSECRLLEACFDYCDLTDADLRGSELHNIAATGVTLEGADLRGATFNNINPREIDLTGVRIYYSQLSLLLEPLGIVIESDPAT